MAWRQGIGRRGRLGIGRLGLGLRHVCFRSQRRADLIDGIAVAPGPAPALQRYAKGILV